MTVDEAIKITQGKPAGLVNKRSVKYAESVLLPGENVAAAMVSNISSQGERFPGIVILTDQRIMAVCGLPGIKRCISLPISELDQCKEKTSAICYQAHFQKDNRGFSLTADTDIGKAFSGKLALYLRYLSVQNYANTPLDAHDATQKLSEQLEEARSDRNVNESDPLSVAARLAAELAEEEGKHD